MLGTAKSLAGSGSVPRSSATTFIPASASSLERMPPVQPSPTMTTSTSFSLVAMFVPCCVDACPVRKTASHFSGHARSAQVRNAKDVSGVLLAAILLDVLAVHRDHAGEADHLPARLVAVAAVDRVGEHALHHGRIDGA